jgi:hypothetical protein
MYLQYVRPAIKSILLSLIPIILGMTLSIIHSTMCHNFQEKKPFMPTEEREGKKLTNETTISMSHGKAQRFWKLKTVRFHVVQKFQSVFNLAIIIFKHKEGCWGKTK